MRFQAAYSTPPVVKNLIILNALFFLAEMVLPAGAGDWMIRHLGLFYWGSGSCDPQSADISLGRLPQSFSV